MPFQFYCPQGHLLEGHESQMGTPGQCPMCGSMFVFPQMGGGAPVPPGYGGMQPGAMPGMPGMQPGPMPGMGGGMFPPAQEPFVDTPPEPEQPTIYRILCPKGHELQTPAEMLGTKAQCPYCNAVLELTIENSVEHKEELARQERFNQQRQRMREEAQGRFWMKLSIFIAVLAIGGMIAGMIYMFRE